MLVDDFAAEENGLVTGRDGKGETGLREGREGVVLNFGGKGLDKTNGDEDDSNTRERGSGMIIASVSLTMGALGLGSMTSHEFGHD